MASLKKTPAGRTCWCGCGILVKDGRFFVPGHDKWAEAYLIRTRYGTVTAFLEQHGYGPGGKNARSEAEQGEATIGAAEILHEADEDRHDAEEADRRLNDPDEVPIPYEEARRRLGLL